MLRNTTNIPDKLVAIAAAFALEGLRDEQGNLPPVAEIIIKNKRHGKVGGQWGWYYHGDNRVVVIVPRKISRAYTTRLKYCRKNITFSSRAEFLVMLLAHEMRHAWQYAHWNTPASKWRLERDRLGKLAREVDAEMYELATLRRWKHEIEPKLMGVA